MSTPCRLLLLLLCQLLWVTIVAAQSEPRTETGTISGIVVDGETGETLIGVAVMIEGTQLGAATDLDGNYKITSLAPGSYNLIANSLGYTKSTVKNVEVNAGEITRINLTLKTEAIAGDEVVIEARQINNTEAALLGIQKRSPTLSDGISAEQIKKSPDSDAGDALKRVTGVTVVGDKNVVVRGLGERYNNTRLNGAALASPEPLKRTVPFDIVPANLLDNIIVSKTFTPDQPGDFAGGSVNLMTKEFPEKLTLTGSIGNSYNDQSTYREFRTYRGGDKDWMAMDDGTRAVPDRVEEETDNPGWINHNDLRRSLAKEFNNIWEPRETSAPLNGSRAFTLGNTSALFGRPLGWLAALNYSTSYASRSEVQYAHRANFNGETGDVVLDTTADLRVEKSVKTIGWGGIFDLNHKLSNAHKVSLKTLYTRSADDEAKFFEGVIDDDNEYQNYRLQWTERSLLNIQPRGTHELHGLHDSRLEWSLVYSRGTFDQPDRRDVYYNYNVDDSAWVFLPTSESGFRRFAEMRDNVYEGSFDWTLPLSFMNKQSKAKFGALSRNQDRSFPTRKFYFRYERDPGTPALDGTLSAEEIFSPRSIDNYFLLAEITRTLDSYEAEMKTTAGYLMFDQLLGNRWRAIYGVRVENTDQHFRTFPPPGGGALDVTEGGPSHTDVLPALGLTYKAKENLNLRLAGSKTIANPDYQEIVPAEDTDYFEGTIKRGNPEIDYTKITNLDFRAEWYPRPWESVSAGVFYKFIEDPIEWFYAPGFAGGEVLLPDNLVDANNIGAELEFRKQLDFLHPLGDWGPRFSAIGNFTVVESNVDLNVKKYTPGEPLTGETVLTNDKRPMMGQSDYIVNFALGFDHTEWGTNARLLLNTFGERVSQVGAYGVPDTYEQPFTRLDLTASQKFGRNWSAKFSATNLLNSKVEFKTGESTQLSYEVGRTFGLGFTYTL